MKKIYKQLFVILIAIALAILGSIFIGNFNEETSEPYISVYETNKNGARLETYPTKVLTDGKVLSIITSSTQTEPFKEMGFFKYVLKIDTATEFIDIKIADNGKIVQSMNLMPMSDIYISEKEFNEIVNIIEDDEK